jgi:uncharacterized protein YebE (UPF0316 family)
VNTTWMTADEALRGLAMAGLAVISVGLWTLRVGLAARRAKVLGAAVAATEAVVFVIAFSSVASDLTSPLRIAGYAVGVALGTLLGFLLEERGSGGTSEIRVVVHGRDDGVGIALSGLGWPATSYAADGPSGPVTVAFLAVDDSRVAHVTAALDRLLPNAFWTVQQLRHTHPSSPVTNPLEATHVRTHVHRPHLRRVA